VKDGEVGIFEVSRDKVGEGAATGLALSFALAGHDSNVVAMGWSPSGEYYLE
jgi:hypothetical protein